jgi:hypothetical protein
MAGREVDPLTATSRYLGSALKTAAGARPTMATIRFPIDGTIVVFDVPDGFSTAALARLLRTTTNAVAAQRHKEAWARGPERPTPVRIPGYPLAVAGRLVRDWNAGVWAKRLRDANAEEAELERLVPDADLPSLDAVMPLLSKGHRLADRRLAGWTRAFLGHDLGGHGDECDACFCMEQGRWSQLCRLLGVQPLSILNYWRSAERGGFADATLLSAALKDSDQEDIL